MITVPSRTKRQAIKTMINASARPRPPLNFHVISLFPEMLQAAALTGVVGQAIRDGKVTLQMVNPRSFTHNVHHTVDDHPFGGSDGMIMMAEPLAQSLESIRKMLPSQVKPHVVHVSPRGRVLNDQLVRELAGFEHLVLISSRYGGVDQRFINEEVDEEVSIGDYVISGGELAALVIIDACSRLQPGVLGNSQSSELESFADGLLEFPQYTRPQAWRSTIVPPILLSGHHEKLKIWKRDLSLLTTAARRPDLVLRALADGRVGQDELSRAARYLSQLSVEEAAQYGLENSLELKQTLSNLAKKGTQ
jgi:tRNA (guanine37-N1)-methyltransferase